MEVLKFWKSWRKTLLLLAVILLLAFFLRIYNLTNLPIFTDEAIYIRWAQIMRVEPGLRFVPLSDGKQPLFMWLVIPMLKLLADPLFAGRFVSVLAGLGTLIGIFVLANLLFKNRKVALIASLFYTFSPFSLFFDRMALVDSTLTFFGVWTLVFSTIAVKKVRLDAAMLSGFALGGAFLTKSPALFYAILLPFTLILHKWPKKKKEIFLDLSVFVFLFSFTYLIAYGMFNVLRLGPNFHMLSIRNYDYVYPYAHIITNPLDPLLSFLKRIFEYFTALGPGLILIFIVLGIWLNYKKYFRGLILLSLWWLVPTFAIAEYSKTMTARYILFTLPFAFILASLAFINIKKSLNKVLIFGLGIFILLSLRNNISQLTNVEAIPLPRSERSGYLEEWTAGGGIREVAQIIRKDYFNNPDEKIVVGTEGYFGTLPDGLQIYLNDIPEITVIGVGIDLEGIPNSLVESKKAGNKTYLVVNSSRLLTDPEKLALEMVAAYPKAIRREGTKEYNMHGPQDALYLFELTNETVELIKSN